MKRTTFLVAFSAMTACLPVSAALAEYPDQPINYVLGYNPGGPSDTAARTWAPFLEECLGGTVNIVNLPGAGGGNAFVEVMNAKPDGYTMGQVTAPTYITRPITSDVPWRTDSFEYIASLTGTRSTVSVRKGSELKTLTDFIAHAKASADPINVGVAAIGGDDHLTALQFARLAGLQFKPIPFGDSALARNALLGGHVDIIFTADAEIGQFKNEIEPLAIAAAQRSKLMPDVQTFGEAGYPLEGGSTHIMSGPKGLPAEIVQKWRDCAAGLFQNEEFLAEATKRSVPLLYMDRDVTINFIKEQEKILGDMWKTTPWVVQ